MMLTFNNRAKNNLPWRGKNGAGFTLIEMVFVLAIFLIIIGVMVDIFISMVKHQKRILLEQELLNQSSYALEYMSKALRTAAIDSGGDCLEVPGYMYLLTHCSGSSGPCQGIKFINHSDNDACQEFFVDTNESSGFALKEMKNDQPAQNLLSEKFTLNNGMFLINGDKTLRFATSSDLVQPRVTLLLNANTNGPLSQQKVVQTTVSLRIGSSVQASGLSCDSNEQCVPGGGGVSCASYTDCLALPPP